jgi:predicted molibdopterin-dependent oxidoreductase YjgC
MVNFSTLWLRQQPGTDTAVFNAMAHVIVKEKLYHEQFIADRTEGFSQYIESLEDKTPEWAEAISGVPAEDIRQAARMYAKASSAAIYWGMGISQSVHGTDNALTLINLALLTGHIGRPGTGLNPLRGQNNVQGCSDSGGMPTVYTAYQPVTNPDIRHKFELAWLTHLPAVPGLTTTEMVDGILTGQVGLVCDGRRPGDERTDKSARHAVEQLEFYVAQTSFNESNVYADIILPQRPLPKKTEPSLTPPAHSRVGQASPARPAPIGRLSTQLTVPKSAGKAHPDSPLIPGSGHLPERRPAAGPLELPTRRHLGRCDNSPPILRLTYERIDREGGVRWPCPYVTLPIFEQDFPAPKFSPDYINEANCGRSILLCQYGRLLYHWHGGSMTRGLAEPNLAGVQSRC